MKHDENKPKLKVTDRRMFTAEGELRASEEPIDGRASEPVQGQAPAVGIETNAPDEEKAESADTRDEDQSDPVTSFPEGATFQGSLPKPGFPDLLSILAEPIPLFLGDVPLPDGKSAENLELARFHIDLLGVLKEKTESNLSQEESTVLDDLLYRLRMRYVQKSQ